MLKDIIIALVIGASITALLLSPLVANDTLLAQAKTFTSKAA